MKKLLPGAILAIALIFAISCNNNPKTESGTHTHDDGSVHTDHDTSTPVQEEFRVTDTIKKDTSSHTHPDGEKHSH
jgi:hypothetical protein